MKIKKIFFNPIVLIQPCRPKSNSAPPGAIWAQFRPKQPNQEAILAHAEKSKLIIQFHCFLSFLVPKVNDFNSKFLLSRELLKI